MRSDRRPTYNFAVVADDVDMEITHVIRGAGHLSNTPKQALLFDALGSPRPVFAHLPTVLAPDGSKLSKRTGAPGIEQLRKEGILPDAILNYVSLLGWSHGEDKEFMSRAELVEALDLDRVGSSNTVYDPEKLRWMSQQHLARMPLDRLAEEVKPYIDGARFPLARFDLSLVVDALRSRLRTLGDIDRALPLLFPDAEARQAALDELRSARAAAAVVLEAVRSGLEAVDPWTSEAISGAVRAAGNAVSAKGPELFHPVRLALLGTRSGPDLGKALAALGRHEVLHRLNIAIQELTP